MCAGCLGLHTLTQDKAFDLLPYIESLAFTPSREDVERFASSDTMEWRFYGVLQPYWKIALFYGRYTLIITSIGCHLNGAMNWIAVRVNNHSITLRKDED